LAQHPIYDNITRTNSSVPIYTAKGVTFDKCGVLPDSPDPFIIEKGCWNTTHYMGTFHWKLEWTHGITNSTPKLKPDMLEPISLNPMRIIHKPMPQRVEITLQREQFNLFYIQSECKIYATELGNAQPTTYQQN